MLFLSSRNRGITVTLLSYRSVACVAIGNEEYSVNILFYLCQIGNMIEAWVGYVTLSVELTVLLIILVHDIILDTVYVQHRVLTFHL